jgi:hypothetical protein
LGGAAAYAAHRPLPKPNGLGGVIDWLSSLCSNEEDEFFEVVEVVEVWCKSAMYPDVFMWVWMTNHCLIDIGRPVIDSYKRFADPVRIPVLALCEATFGAIEVSSDIMMWPV